MRPANKVVQMTRLGKIIASDANERIISSGLVKMSVLDYLASVLPLGTKTIQRRLSNDEWTYKELLELQAHLKSDEIQDYLNRQFTDALKS